MAENLKLLYVTAEYPFGRGEGFLEPEVSRLLELGVTLEIVPLRRRGGRRSTDLTTPVARASLAGARVLLHSLVYAVRRPRAIWRLVRLLGGARRSHRLKNLAVIPLATRLATKVEREHFTHVHAHWLAGPGSLALAVHELSGVGFSLTGHRWDIYDNNLLEPKVNKAQFVRFISDSGLCAFQATTGLQAPNSCIIHMGVAIDDEVALPEEDQSRGTHPLRVVAVGNLLPVKGHTFLLEAVAECKSLGSDMVVDIFGDGDLREELETQSERLGLTETVRFFGQISRSELLSRYRTGAYEVIVVPSVDLGNGVHEGIPVALIEAMAFEVCPVSTTTGGIPELVESGASGILVPGGDPQALALALRRLEDDPDLRRTLARQAAVRARSDFDVKVTCDELIARMSGDPID